MRRIISFLLILMAIAANARQVSPNEAQSVAADFFGSSNGPKNVSPKGVKRVAPKDLIADNQPYYVFNAADNAGFVIISGDDRARKILGYSDKGAFDFNNLPPQLNWLLNEYEKQIASIPATASQDQSWKSPATPVAGEGVLLETANWGQGAPYNAQCPVIDGVQAPTGCVATAMAIVMKYHNWPENYNWEAMPISDVTAENSSETAKLMSDAGKAVLMSYGPYESGANMNWVGHKLQQDFKYSPECQYITAQNFSNEEWIGMLRSNIDNGQPVIYSGTDKSRWVSHAFIIDGYTDSEYHINWGWNGLFNGYYALEALRPEANSDYSSDCGMVMNITPDHSGKTYSKCFVDYGYFYLLKGKGIGFYANKPNFSPDSSCDFSLRTFNFPRGEKGEYALAIVDRDGNIKELLQKNTYDATYQGADNVVGQSLSFINVTPQNEVDDNEYITLVAKSARSNEWLKVLGTLESPTEMPAKDIYMKTTKVTFICDESGLTPLYWKGYNDPEHHTIRNNDIVYFTYGLSNIQLSVLDALGGSLAPNDQVLIRVENGITGEIIEDWHSNMAAFSCYEEEIIIRITSLKADNSEVLTIEQPGTLETLCSNINPFKTGTLTLKGNINAKDLWYIRDNFSNLKKLDINACTIHSCTETDPIEEYRNAYEGLYPDNVIPAYALKNLTKLRDIVLSDNIIEIQQGAFANLSLKAIELPSALETIAMRALSDNPELNIVIFKGMTPPTIDATSFEYTMVPESAILICPNNTASTYQNDTYCKQFKEIIEDSNISVNDITIIHNGVKYGLTPGGAIVYGYDAETINTECLTIPDEVIFGNTDRKVLEIKENAFEYCLAKKIVLSNNVLKIGASAFASATMLEEITLPNKLDEIPAGMFTNCSSLKEMIIPESVTLLSYAFDGCISLERFYIPAKTKGSVFYRSMIGSCFESLTAFEVHPDNESWTVVDGVLYTKNRDRLISCPGLKTGVVKIGNETTVIESDAFDRCSHLSGIVFEGDHIELGYLAMNIGDTEIEHIEFPNMTLFYEIQSLYIRGLKSICLGDFSVSTFDGMQCLPSDGEKLKVYMKNQNNVTYSEEYMPGCSEWEYYSSKLCDNVTLPVDAPIYVPGKCKNVYSITKHFVTEMWSYDIDRSHNLIKIEPAIDGIEITSVVVNGETLAPISGCYYEITPTDNLDVVVNYTLHNRQAMTTHYDAEFNAQIADTELSLPISVASIEITPASVRGEVGAECQLTATVMPENATNKAIEWSSDNTEVATVDANGLLSLLSQGTATITATAADGSGVQAQCKVIVDTPSGIEDVVIDADGEVKIYNTAGALLFDGKYSDAKLEEGFYIIVTNGNRYKCHIK